MKIMNARNVRNITNVTNVLSIAYYAAIRSLRDTKSLCLMLLFPVILILILGTALSGAYSPRNIGKTAICYMNMDKGVIGRQFDSFLKSDDIKDLVTITGVSSESEGIRQVSAGKAAALVEIPGDFTSKSLAGKKSDIMFYANKNNNLGVSVVQSVLDGFANAGNAVLASIQVKRPDSGMRADNKSYSVIEERPISVNGKIPRAIDYYSVTMLVLIMLYGAMYGVYGIGDDFLGPMGTRLRSAPVKLFQQLSGTAAGIVVCTFLQSIVLIAFTGIVYKADWGRGIPVILLTSFSLAVFSIALGMAACLLARERGAAAGILNIIIPVSTFLSGGYMKIGDPGPVINAIRYVLPNNLAQTAMFNSIYGGPAFQTRLSISILWGLAAAMIVLASLAGRRRFN